MPGGLLPRVKANSSAGMAGLLNFPPAFREAAFMECMDCFAAMIADAEVWHATLGSGVLQLA